MEKQEECGDEADQRVKDDSGDKSHFTSDVKECLSIWDILHGVLPHSGG